MKAEKKSDNGITAKDVLDLFPGARIIPRKSEFEMWLEAQGVPEADRQAILEEAARWFLEDGRWQRTVVDVTREDMTKPENCQRCGDNKHARVVKRTWPGGQWDWMCHACGREVEQ